MIRITLGSTTRSIESNILFLINNHTANEAAVDNGNKNLN